MSFKKKLILIFTIVLIMPVILISVSFLVIGNMVSAGDEDDRGWKNYNELTTSADRTTEVVDTVYDTIKTAMIQDPYAAGDKDYLETLTQGPLKDTDVYILVRRNGTLYYTGNEKDAQKIIGSLPAYDGSALNDGVDIYKREIRRLIKQMDFVFEDGAEGSLFLIAPVRMLVSRNFIAMMSLACVAVLFITGMVLTRVVDKSLFEPIRNLDIAMNQIRDGNLDYRLTTDQKGEIGDLYRNYEDMRLRLKESADEKLEDEKHDRELISNISHDLKTPITSVKGYVEGLIDGVANTPDKQEKYLRTIYNKANDMDRLINELTLYTKIDSNKIPYNFRRLNVAEYFSDCVEELGMDLDSRGFFLTYENMVARDVEIIADPEQLKRVINNIIGNSIKYNDKPKGHIDIRLLDEQDAVRVEIEDNGKGISQKDLPNIFDRFFRADSSRNSAQGGSGIGLSIVKKIIEDHGGYIWATSREGEGTCMHFVLRKYHDQNAESVDAPDVEVTNAENTHRT